MSPLKALTYAFSRMSLEPHIDELTDDFSRMSLEPHVDELTDDFSRMSLDSQDEVGDTDMEGTESSQNLNSQAEFHGTVFGFKNFIGNPNATQAPNLNTAANASNTSIQHNQPAIIAQNGIQQSQAQSPSPNSNVRPQPTNAAPVAWTGSSLKNAAAPVLSESSADTDVTMSEVNGSGTNQGSASRKPGEASVQSFFYQSVFKAPNAVMSSNASNNASKTAVHAAPTGPVNGPATAAKPFVQSSSITPTSQASSAKPATSQKPKTSAGVSGPPHNGEVKPEAPNSSINRPSNPSSPPVPESSPTTKGSASGAIKDAAKAPSKPQATPSVQKAASAQSSNTPVGAIGPKSNTPKNSSPLRMSTSAEQQTPETGNGTGSTTPTKPGPSKSSSSTDVKVTGGFASSNATYGQARSLPSTSTKSQTGTVGGASGQGRSGPVPDRAAPIPFTMHSSDIGHSVPFNPFGQASQPPPYLPAVEGLNALEEARKNLAKEQEEEQARRQKLYASAYQPARPT